jgi:cytochrome c
MLSMIRAPLDPNAGNAAFARIGSLLSSALLTVAFCVAALPASAAGGDPEAGKAVFQSQCSSCHSPIGGKNMMGPSLFGVVGRQAGKAPGFKYSAANTSSDLVWDEAELDKYLTKPSEVVPHTTMTFGGLHDGLKRANLIAYLETLK